MNILEEKCDVCGTKEPHVGMVGTKFACYECYDDWWRVQPENQDAACSLNN